MSPDRLAHCSPLAFAPYRLVRAIIRSHYVCCVLLRTRLVACEPVPHASSLGRLREASVEGLVLLSLISRGGGRAIYTLSR